MTMVVFRFAPDLSDDQRVPGWPDGYRTADITPGTKLVTAAATWQASPSTHVEYGEDGQTAQVWWMRPR